VSGGGNVTLNDANTINLGASTISGDLNVSTNGAITDSGNLTVANGTATLNANNNDITLNNANNFSTVTVTRGRNVTLNDINSMALGASTMTGNLDVSATDVNVSGTVETGGNITLKPSNDTSTIALNDTNGTFNLNATDLGNLSSTGTVTIGRTSGTGAINIGSIGAIDLCSTTYNLTLNGGSVAFSNGITLGTNKTLTLNTGAITSGTNIPDTTDITIGGTNGKLVLNTTAAVGTMTNPLSTQISQLQTTNSGGVFLSNTGNINLNTSNINGDFKLTTDDGDITDSGSLTITGTTTLDAGSNTITLDNANDFSTVADSGGGNVTLNDANTINLGASTISGDLNVSTNGAITDSGNLNIANGTTTLNTNGNDITLNNDNNFNTVAVSGGANVTLNDTNAIVLGTSTISGNLNVQANGTITDSGNLNVVNGTSQFNANGNDITLDNNNNFKTVAISSGNNVTLNDTNAIELGASTINGSFNVTANGNITDSGNLTIANGTTRLNANGNDISLNNDNDFNTVEVNSGNNVTLNDINSIDLGTSTITGDLGVTANDTLSTSATVDVGGDMTLTAAEMDFLGGTNTVSGNGTIELQPRTPTQEIAIAGTEGTQALDISQRDIDALDGFNPTNPIIIGQDNSSNPVRIVNDVTFDDAVKIQSPQGSIAVDGNIIGTGNASIELNSSDTKINADITTEGQTITIGNNPNPIDDNNPNPIGDTGDTIEISAVIVIISTGGDQAGNIIFTGNVNGRTESEQTLQVSPGTGEVVFRGEVGNIYSLESLIIGDNVTGNADLVGSATTVFNSLFVNAEQTRVAGEIKTTGGPIEFTGHVILLTDVTFDTTFNTENTDKAGNIMFGATVSSAISDDSFPNDSYTPPFNLTLIAGKGKIEFQGDVGAQNFGSGFVIPETQDLGSLTIESAGEVKAVVADDASLPLTISTLAPEMLPEDAPKGISILADSIDFSNANLETEIDNLEATENISTASVTATEENITLNSEVGSIDTSNGTLTATQGDVNLSASEGDITTADIEVTQGVVDLTANQGSVTTANVEALRVNVEANNDISTASVTATEEDITLDSATGSIDTSEGTLSATQGDVNLSASQGNITTADIEGESVNLQADNEIATANVSSTNGGITVTSQSGSIQSGDLTANGETQEEENTVTLSTPNSITTGNIDTSSESGTGGAIALTSQTGDITTQNLNSSGPLGGGSIDASTLGQITLAEVNSSSTGGFAGLITLNNGQPEFLRDAPGIDLTFINAQGLPRNPAAISLSPTETEGTEITINITTDGYFRATGTFVSQTGIQASLATGGDPIVIRHGGGTAFDPFEVGNSTQNGTAGAITNGNGFTGTILPVQSFTRPVRQENIEILARIPSQNNLPVTSVYPNLSVSNQVADADLEISTLDSVLTDAFSGYLGPKPSVNNPADAPEILNKIQ
ncbi:MAG: hypothetical protein RLP02_29375, partial [Coleofasciculus sp. C2-GNP5-27]